MPSEAQPPAAGPVDGIASRHVRHWRWAAGAASLLLGGLLVQHLLAPSGPGRGLAEGVGIGLALLLLAGASILAHRNQRRLERLVERLSDRTDAERAEQQLRRLSQAVEQNPNSILITETDGRITYVNDSFSRITGYAADEVLGRSINLLKSGQTDPAVLTALWQTLERGGTWRGEFVNRRKNGEVYVTFSRVSPIRQPDGRVSHYLGIEEDITERKRIGAELDQHRHHLEAMVAERTRELQQALSAREESDLFLRVVADNLPTAIAYWDHDLRLRFANPPYLHGFIDRPGEALGQHADELFGDEVMQPHHAAIARALQGEPSSWSLDRRGKDGEVHHFLAQRLPDLRDGEVRGYFVFATEVSELKQAERRLQQLNEELTEARDRAELANRSKSAFMANMSHEIRTPMNAIIGLTHVLLRDAPEPQQRERLGKVADAAQLLLDLINDILDLSKIEAGKLQLEQVDFALDEVLARCTAMVADRARDKQLHLEVHSAGCPAELRGDPTRLSQALLNLLSNAIKFTERGSISLRVSALPSRAGRAGARLRFEVEDTGIGIDAAQLQHLFSAFSQADSSTTRRYGGTGLGLAITRQLAQLMGGEAGADSEFGKGSRFWFTACFEPASGLGPPAAAPQIGASAGAAELALRSRHAGRLVLLAEDNPINQQVACELLSQVGLQVDVAGDGEQAVAMAPLRPYALVLMDMQMPRMDGLEATRRLRRVPGWEHRPILAITANAYPEDRAACLAAGMNDHIAKPVDSNQLYACLLRWLDRADRGAAGQGLPDSSATPPSAPAGAAAAAVPNAVPTLADPALDALRGIAALDLERGVYLCSGRSDIYRQILLRFARLYGQGLPVLDHYLGDGRLDGLHGAAHSLRGAAAVVGAGALQVSAARLEALSAPGKAPGPELVEAAAQVRAVLRALVEQLHQHLADELAA